MSSRPTIHVVAGALIDDAERVLIAQRPVGKHLAGGWEFPGGKLEPGEDRIAGLARELREELGIGIRMPPRPLIRVYHAYPARSVLLDVWVVRSAGGEPRGLDGQALRWCALDDLAGAQLLPADRPILAALRLPERLRVARSDVFRVDEEIEARNQETLLLRGLYCATPAAALRAAARADFVVLRAALPADELSALCAALEIPVYARGIALEAAWILGASGVNEIEG